jgi:acid phosphatase type 7
MRAKLGLLLALALVCVAESPKATGPTFKIELSELPAAPVFVIYGDTRFTNWRFARNASSPWARQALVNKIAFEKPGAIFISGDLPFRGAHFGDYKVFERETQIWGDNRFRIYPVLGNHEFYNRNLFVSREGGIANWWKEFPKLKGLRWYSVQLGEQVYVLCLDSNFGALGAGGPQRLWLQQQLSSLPPSINYVFFVLHHARAGDYLEGRSASYDPQATEDDLEVFLEHRQKRTRERFIVVAGHDHNYGRMERNGVMYIVSGGGGAHPVFFRRQPEDAFKDKDLLMDGKALPNYNYVRFELASDHLNAAMIRVSNPMSGGQTPLWDAPDTFTVRTMTNDH